MKKNSIKLKKNFIKKFIDDAIFVYEKYSIVTLLSSEIISTRECLAFMISKDFENKDTAHLEYVLNFAFNGNLPFFLKEKRNIGWVFLIIEVYNSIPFLLKSAEDLDIIVFHHVPKCAGTSVASALVESLNYNRFDFATNEYNLTNIHSLLPVAKIIYELFYYEINGVLITGHFNIFDYMSRFINNELKSIRVLSIFKHPTEIVYSFLKYIIGSALSGNNIPLIDILFSDNKESIDPNEIFLENNVEHMLNKILYNPRAIDVFSNVLSNMYQPTPPLKQFDCSPRDFLLLSSLDTDRITNFANSKVILPKKNISLISRYDLDSCIDRKIRNRILKLSNRNIFIYNELIRFV